MSLESATAAKPPQVQKRRGRILVVDDDRFVLDAVNHTLKDQHDLFVATNAEQAAGLCRRRPPDLILLDLVMPGIDGLQLCKRLKADSATEDIPVIFLTGRSDGDAEERCWQTGAVDFIAKPFNATTLRNRVNAHLSVKFHSDLLRGLVFADGLTGVANRRLFDERLVAEWRRCGRAAQPLSLAMIDVDCFKLYNDHYGHMAGDDCLRAVAAALRDVLKRPYDLLARYGGEEFVCLLPETDLVGAGKVALCFEQAVRALGLPHMRSTAADIVTISVGVATVIPPIADDPGILVRQADERLYRAKSGGRGRVVSAALEPLSAVDL